MTLSAKGTRLNRRGLETRTQLLETAVACLAAGGPDAVSANLVARRAGATWGTVQHQFGDADGLWAAVLAHIGSTFGSLTPEIPPGEELGARVRSIVEMLWRAVDLPISHAIYNLRLALPRERDELESSYPRTAAALASWDRQWTDACTAAFADLPVEPTRLRRVVSLLPGALMGLRTEEHLVTYIDLGEAREGLTGAVTAYLTAP